MLEFPGINEVLFCDAIKYQYLGSLALPSLLYWSNESVCIDRALIKCGSEYERVQFHSQLYQSARESQPVREEFKNSGTVVEAAKVSSLKGGRCMFLHWWRIEFEK